MADSGSLFYKARPARGNTFVPTGQCETNTSPRMRFNPFRFVDNVWMYIIGYDWLHFFFTLNNFNSKYKCWSWIFSSFKNITNFFCCYFQEIKNSLEVFPSLDFLRKSIASNEDASGSVKSASKLQDLHQKLSQIQDYKEVLVDAASETIYVGAK